MNSSAARDNARIHWLHFIHQLAGKACQLGYLKIVLDHMHISYRVIRYSDMPDIMIQIPKSKDSDATCISLVYPIYTTKSQVKFSTHEKCN